MAYSTVFASVVSATGAQLDADLNEAGRLGTVACSVTGTNAIVLTPVVAGPPFALQAGVRASGVALNSNTGATTANVGATGALPVYLDTAAGPVALAGGEIVADNAFVLIYDAALNTGGGGWHLENGVTSGTPSGSAGGDLSGSYPNPTVAKVNGVSYPASPTANLVPVANGSGAVVYSIVPGAAGGTGVNNTSKTITLGGNLTTSGAFATTITVTNTTNSTLPAGTHTLGGLDVIQSWTAEQTYTANMKVQSTMQLSAISAPGTPGAGTQYLYVDTADNELKIKDENALVSTLSPRTVFIQTQSVNVVNTVTETAITGTGVGSLTIPANFFKAGRTLKVHGIGFYGAAASPTIQVKLKFGSTVVLDTGVVTSPDAGQNVFWIDGIITCWTTGAGGTVQAQGAFTQENNSNTGAPFIWGMLNNSTVSIDTTASQTISITIQWGTAAGANTLTLPTLIIESLLP